MGFREMAVSDENSGNQEGCPIKLAPTKCWQLEECNYGTRWLIGNAMSKDLLALSEYER